MVGTRGIEPLTPTMSRDTAVTEAALVTAKIQENKALQPKSRARTYLELAENLLGPKARR